MVDRNFWYARGERWYGLGSSVGGGGDRGVGQGAEWQRWDAGEWLSAYVPWWLRVNAGEGGVDRVGASFLGGLDFETHTL